MLSKYISTKDTSGSTDLKLKLNKILLQDISSIVWITKTHRKREHENKK